MKFSEFSDLIKKLDGKKFKDKDKRNNNVYKLSEFNYNNGDNVYTVSFDYKIIDDDGSDCGFNVITFCDKIGYNYCYYDLNNIFNILEEYDEEQEKFDEFIKNYYGKKLKFDKELFTQRGVVIKTDFSNKIWTLTKTWQRILFFTTHDKNQTNCLEMTFDKYLKYSQYIHIIDEEQEIIKNNCDNCVNYKPIIEKNKDTTFMLTIINENNNKESISLDNIDLIKPLICFGFNSIHRDISENSIYQEYVREKDEYMFYKLNKRIETKNSKHFDLIVIATLSLKNKDIKLCLFKDIKLIE